MLYIPLSLSNTDFNFPEWWQPGEEGEPERQPEVHPVRGGGGHGQREGHEDPARLHQEQAADQHYRGIFLY